MLQLVMTQGRNVTINIAVKKLPNGPFPKCPKASPGLPEFRSVGLGSARCGKFHCGCSTTRATKDPRPAAQQHHRIYASNSCTKVMSSNYTRNNRKLQTRQSIRKKQTVFTATDPPRPLAPQEEPLLPSLPPFSTMTSSGKGGPSEGVGEERGEEEGGKLCGMN